MVAANKGKVIQNEGGFAKIRKDGGKDYTMPTEPAKLALTSFPPIVTIFGDADDH